MPFLVSFRNVCVIVFSLKNEGGADEETCSLHCSSKNGRAVFDVGGTQLSVVYSHAPTWSRTAVPKTAIAVFDVGGTRLRVVYSYTPTCVLTPANLPVA